VKSKNLFGRRGRMTVELTAKKGYFGAPTSKIDDTTMKHPLTILSLLACLSASANTRTKIAGPDSLLCTGWYYISDSITKFKRQLEKTNDFLYVIPGPITSAKDIIRMTIYNRKEGGHGLAMKLGNNGANAWSRATHKWIAKRLGFILDNKLLEVDYVNSEITGGMTVLIGGNFTKEELEKFKKIIEGEISVPFDF